jgi:short-subunit dehydrogenase
MISEGFVQNGATVYVSSRDAKACQQACEELNALGKGKADFIAADLYKEDAAKNIADELKKRAGSTYIHSIFNRYDCTSERTKS